MSPVLFIALFVVCTAIVFLLVYTSRVPTVKSATEESNDDQPILVERVRSGRWKRILLAFLCTVVVAFFLNLFIFHFDKTFSPARELLCGILFFIFCCIFHARHRDFVECVPEGQLEQSSSSEDGGSH